MKQKFVDLLNIIQSDFPIESRPFLDLANKLDITEEEVIKLVKKFKELGYIRRLGGVFDSEKLGYVSALCAIEVPKERIDKVAAIINSYGNVTHNYLRVHKYNMWFTLTAPSNKSMESIIESIKSGIKINNILVLKSVNTFKIKVNFHMEGV